MRPINPTCAASALKTAPPERNEKQSRSGKVQRPPELDEAFLLKVDRTVVLGKHLDPYRLSETARAMAEEVRLAHLSGVYDLDPERRRTR